MEGKILLRHDGFDRKRSSSFESLVLLFEVALGSNFSNDGEKLTRPRMNACCRIDACKRRQQMRRQISYSVTRYNSGGYIKVTSKVRAELDRLVKMVP